MHKVDATTTNTASQVVNSLPTSCWLNQTISLGSIDLDATVTKTVLLLSFSTNTERLQVRLLIILHQVIHHLKECGMKQ